MRCEECGAELATRARFCANCGASAVSGGGAAPYPTAPQAAPERPVRSRPWGWLVVVVAVIVSAGGAAVVAVQRGAADGLPTVVPSLADGASLGATLWSTPLGGEQGWWWSDVGAVGGTALVSHYGGLHGVDPESGELRWRRAFDTVDAWRGSTTQHVVVGDDLLVVHGRAGGGFTLRSVDPVTGLDRWARDEEAGSAGISGGEHSAYLQIWTPDPEDPNAPGHPEVARLDPVTGELSWRRTFGGGWPQAVSDDFVAFVHGQDETRPNGEWVGTDWEAIILDGRTGEELWRRPLGTVRADSNRSYPGPQAAVGGGIVVLVDTDGHLVAHEAATGAVLWEGGETRRERAGIVDDLLLDLDEQGFIVARELTSGAVRWQSEERFQGGVPLEIAGDGLLLVPYGGTRLTAIDLEDGTTRWEVRAAAASYGGTVIDGNFITMSQPTGSSSSPGMPMLQALDVASGESRWSLVLPGRSPLEVFGGPGWVASVDDTSVRVQDADMGSPRVFPSTTVESVVAAAPGPGGQILVVGQTYSGNRGNGWKLSAIEERSVRWSVRLPARQGPDRWIVPVGLVVAGDRAIVAVDSSLRAYDVEDGDLVHTMRMADTVTGLLGTPQGILVATEDGALSLAPEVGAGPRWSVPLADVMISPRSVTDRVAYGTLEGRELLAIGLEDGAVRWRHDPGGPLSEAPVAAGGSVLGVIGQTLVAVDRGNGDPRWRQTFAAPLAGPPAATDDAIRIALTDGSVLELDAATGETRGQVILGDHIAAGPWIVGDTTYVVTVKSKLVAIGHQPESTSTVTPPPILDRP